MSNERASLLRKDGKFIGAALVLIGTKTALPNERLGPKEKKLLREVSDIFYAGLAWQRLCDGKLAQKYVPLDASDAHGMLLHVNGSKKADWQRAREAVATLNSVAVGQRPDSLAVAVAAQLCTDAGAYLQRWKEDAARR